jgi:hypothetical protein
MQFKQKGKFLFFLLILLSLAVNIFAAIYYPSWFDEAVISDIAYNFYKNSKFEQTIFITDAPPWIYGPIYFYISKFLLYFFKFTPFLLRSINGIAVYLLAYFFYLTIALITKNKTNAVIFTLLLLFDPEINRSAVSGRMDMLSTLFVFCGFYHLIRFNSSNDSILSLSLSALFCASAYLTTPRGLFLLPLNFLVFLFLYKNKYKKNSFNTKGRALPLFAFLLAFSIPIFIWVYSRGGFSEYLNTLSKSKVSMAHIGPTFFRRKLDYILISFSLFLYAINFKSNYKNIFLNSIFLTYISFSIFVKEVGPYASMIYPFIYLFIALQPPFSEGINSPPKFNTLLVFPKFLFIVYSAIWMARSIDILYVNKECRNSTLLKESVLNKISKNSNVIADYEFYFLLKESSKNLAEFNSFIANIQHFKFSPDFIVLTNVEKKSLEELYPGLSNKLGGSYKILRYFECGSKKERFSSIFSYRKNYDGTIVFSRTDLPE